MVHHPWPTPPGPGEAVEVAEGVLWARLPIPFPGLDHVDVYALDDGATWTLVDTGLDWKRGREAMAALRAGPLGGRPLARVILTHHHPDHMGLAGHFASDGAEILASRVAWLTARMLLLDVQERPTREQVRFRNRAGVTGADLEAYATERPFNLADAVAPLPLGFTRLTQGQRIEAAGRGWRVRLGEGHAPEMVTLWAEDGTLVLTGDQVLPHISPNIGVSATEPEADPLAGFLATCRRFREIGADPLALPGHGGPFRGLDRRLRALIDNHDHALARLEARLAEGPATAVEVFDTLYRRRIGRGEAGLALAEAVAHLNHLHARGRATRRLGPDGALRYAPA